MCILVIISHKPLVDATTRAAPCNWQDGPADGDNEFYACTFLGDGSVVLGGYTNGEWDGPNNGGRDFAMVKLNALGLEEWRWQVPSNCWTELLKPGSMC